MNNKLEQCINRVQDEIKTIETSLADTGNHLTTAVEQKAESPEAGWKNALAKCDAKREQAGQAGQRLRQFLEEKKDEFACEPRGPGTNKHLFGTGANGENGEEASASVSFRLRGAPQRRFGATAAEAKAAAKPAPAQTIIVQTAPAKPALTPTEQKLAELKSMLNQGFITQAQYEQASQKVISEMVQ